MRGAQKINEKCKLRINFNNIFKHILFQLKALLISPRIKDEGYRFSVKKSDDVWRLSCCRWFVTLPHTIWTRKEAVVGWLQSHRSGISFSNCFKHLFFPRRLFDGFLNYTRVKPKSLAKTCDRWLIKQMRLPHNKFN